MPRVKTLTRSLAIWMFASDHAPPHFHVMSPETDVLVDLRTLQVIAGTYKRKELAEALAWAADAANQAALMTEWRRLNERD